MSQLTTHILDTSIGKPAAAVQVKFEKLSEGVWMCMATGITNSDGRISELLPSDFQMDLGIYRLIFDTGSYFKKQNIQSFYPSVAVEFQVNDTAHYHVPLLLNPYGYSTYRGS